MKVLIGVPSMDMSRSHMWARLDAVEKPAGTHVMCAHESSIARARNLMCEAALTAGASHLLMVDDDMLLPSDTLTRLLSHDVDVVSAHYRGRYLPFPAVIVDHFTQEGMAHLADVSERRGLLKVAGVGTGCLLLNTRILAQLPKPWFVVGDPIPDLIAEDFTFCRKLTAHGIPIHVDLDIAVGHVASLALWPLRKTRWGIDVRGVD